VWPSKRPKYILTRSVAFPLPASTQISGGTSSNRTISKPSQQAQKKKLIEKTQRKQNDEQRERANLPEPDDGCPLGLEHGDEDGEHHRVAPEHAADDLRSGSEFGNGKETHQ